MVSDVASRRRLLGLVDGFELLPLRDRASNSARYACSKNLLRSEALPAMELAHGIAPSHSEGKTKIVPPRLAH